jgi:hypothetical protein
MLRAAIRGRHRITTDQRLRQREWVCQIVQSRSSSLMEVLARVCSSTILTMTAQ